MRLNLLEAMHFEQTAIQGADTDLRLCGWSFPQAIEQRAQPHFTGATPNVYIFPKVAAPET